MLHLQTHTPTSTPPNTDSGVDSFNPPWHLSSFERASSAPAKTNAEHRLTHWKTVRADNVHSDAGLTRCENLQARVGKQARRPTLFVAGDKRNSH